jgi:hypothetical protein
VEGFIAALRNPTTRFVTFAWGEFSFKGVLNYVGAEYVMFSKKGNPVRALINMRINYDPSEDYDDYIDSFNTVFSQGGSLASAASKVGNLLGLDGLPFM